MKITGVFLIVLCFLVACNGRYDHKGKTPLVEVAGQFLYQEELQSALPLNLSRDDSVLFAEHFIKNWVEDALLYDKAESNIPDNDRIDKLVENYRKALIVHAYQQELINQDLSEVITEKEIDEYYNQNKALFVSQRSLIKGLFIKVPVKSPDLNKVRSWYKKETPEAIDHLEKYSLRNAVSYDYFYDKWIPAIDVLDKIPLKAQNPESYLQDHRNIEIRDSAYYYFLHISQYLEAGEQEPLEFAKGGIKDMLTNLKRVEFMQRVKGDLYENAAKKKKIKYYY